MKLEYATSAYDRERGNFPFLPVINMFAEKTASEDVSLISRPGLKVSDLDGDSNEVKTLFKRDGVLGGELYRLSGDVLWKDDSIVGSIDGNGPGSITGYQDLLFVNAGEQIWKYDGTLLTSVVFPDDSDVSKIVTGASRLIAIKKDTQTFYWSEPLSDTIDGLAFAAAEFSTDRLLDMIFLGDTLILFGSETTEFWPSTSDDPDLPFQPLQGRTFDVGIKRLGACTPIGDSFAWVTNKNQVCITSPTNIVSNPGINAEISRATSVKLWRFFLEGVEFLALSLNNRTWVLNISMGTWSIFKSHEEDDWIVQCWEADYFGSRGGQIFIWDEDAGFFEEPLERQFRAFANISSGGEVINNITVRANPGWTAFVLEPYATPSIEMRTSKDGGNTWGNWRSKSFGSVGEYRETIRWNGCGMFSQPGLLVDIRVTDSVPFRVSGVFANEAFGGI